MSRVNIAPDRWFQLPAPTHRACDRCGRRRRIREGRTPPPICRDCITVARDLGELDLWTGAA